jgi:hypothetical protein
MHELLRHSNLRSTLDVYTQAFTPAKHAARAAVVALVFSVDSNEESPFGAQKTVGTLLKQINEELRTIEGRTKKDARRARNVPFLRP